MARFLVFFALSLLLLPMYAQNGSKGELPRVFVLGEHENAYDHLVLSYKATLLKVSGNDMQKAFDIWTSFLQEIESYARNAGKDLTGVKLWLHVFWNADGSISHIAFHLRPDSKNMDVEELQQLFDSFAEFYRLPITADQPFMHYTTVTFPVFSN